MKIGRLALTLAATLTLPGCLTTASPEPEILHVMLQGDSSQELTALVKTLGGDITHDLHLINAIGVKMTPAQLQQALRSDHVEFYIDDLAVSGEPPEDDEEETDAPCRVRGHIELTIDDNGVDWPVFNKRDEPVTWESIEVHWPERLGTLERVTLDGVLLPTTSFTATTKTSTKIVFPAATQPILAQQAHLRFDFANTTSAATRPAQSEFKIVTTFAEGCSDKSVPGYVNNHEDYYYNTVAGVNAFHHEGITGDGVTVAVIDSGLWEHPALMRNTRGEPRVVARYNVRTDTLGREVVDESGHGTHMSSIIAHSGPTQKDGEPTGAYKGVAPDVRLVAVKVLDRLGHAHILDIAEAVQWVVDNREKYNIQVLNISLAQRPRWPYWEDPVTQVVMRAWAAGITVIAAASNEGPELMSIGSPGNLPYVITVGAVTDSWTPDTRDDDYIPDFSSRGPTPSGHVKPDIVALGGHMTGLTHPDSDLATSNADNVLASGELVSTGSSQAAAFVSGLAALLLQLEPDLTPDDIKCKLITSAEPAINQDGKLAYSPFTQGYGYVTAPRAVTLGETGCGNIDLDIAADIEGTHHFYGPATFDDNGTPSLDNLDKLVSDTPSAKGMSDTRKWGVKEHIERLDEQSLEQQSADDQPFDWPEIYQTEKAVIEALGAPIPD